MYDEAMRSFDKIKNTLYYGLRILGKAGGLFFLPLGG
jgi:hypothetical protein